MLNSPIDEIKKRLDVVEVIGQYIKLQKAGINYRANCPFHSEKKPSFFVSPGRQIWHCFGCGKGGDLIGFVKEIEGVEFGDALRILAQKAGIELRRQDPQLQTERARLYEICELACKFFERQLQESKTGREAKDYLRNRGVIDDSIKLWRLGYAPDNWTALSDFLVGQGYSREEAVKAGLAIQKEENIGVKSAASIGLGSDCIYDRFRGRIMFPVCDFQGKVIGFGGRVFKREDPAKYVNSPATPLYDKGRVLYGLDKSKVDIRNEDSCILVEGYMDTIMIFQAGHKNVVATSGTALTSHQLRILKRYSENLYTAFDMDVAGDTATKRGIDLARQEGFNVKVIVMPQGRDPADMVAENAASFVKLLENARGMMDFYFESAFSKFDPSSPEGKKQIAKAVLPQIARIPNAIERAHWRQKLAVGLGVPEEDVEQELKNFQFSISNFQTANDNPVEPLPSKNKRDRKEILEEYVLSLLLRWRDKINVVEDRVLSLFSEPVRQAIESLRKDNFAVEPTVVFANISSNSGAAFTERFNYLLLRAESEEQEDEKEVERELTKALVELEDLDRRSRLQELTLRLREAERNGDEDGVKELLGKVKKIITASKIL